MRRAKGENAKAVVFETNDHVAAWYDKNDGCIHLTSRALKGFHVRIGTNPTKPYGHPNLFRRLSKCLNEVGAPNPPLDSGAPL